MGRSWCLTSRQVKANVLFKDLSAFIVFFFPKIQIDSIVIDVVIRNNFVMELKWQGQEQ